MPVWRRFFSVFPTGVGVISSCLQQEDPSARILYNGPSIRAMRS